MHKELVNYTNFLCYICFLQLLTEDHSKRIIKDIYIFHLFSFFIKGINNDQIKRRPRKKLILNRCFWPSELSSFAPSPVKTSPPNLITNRGHRKELSDALWDVCVLTFPEQHLSRIDHVRSDSLGHFKGEVCRQGKLSYGVNKAESIDVAQQQSDVDSLINARAWWTARQKKRWKIRNPLSVKSQLRRTGAVFWVSF